LTCSQPALFSGVSALQLGVIKSVAVHFLTEATFGMLQHQPTTENKHVETISECRSSSMDGHHYVKGCSIRSVECNCWFENSMEILRLTFRKQIDVTGRFFPSK